MAGESKLLNYRSFSFTFRYQLAYEAMGGGFDTDHNLVQDFAFALLGKPLLSFGGHTRDIGTVSH